MDFFLNLGIRIFYFLKWFYDNISVLSEIKFLKCDPVKFSQKAFIFEFLACILSLI